MGVRGSVGVVGLIRMGQHAVGDSRLQRTTGAGRAYHWSIARCTVEACEAERDLPGRQPGARNHGGQGVEDMLLRLLHDRGGESPIAGRPHVGAQFVHDRRIGGPERKLR